MNYDGFEKNVENSCQTKNQISNQGFQRKQMIIVDDQYKLIIYLVELTIVLIIILNQHSNLILFYYLFLVTMNIQLTIHKLSFPKPPSTINRFKIRTKIESIEIETAEQVNQKRHIWFMEKNKLSINQSKLKEQFIRFQLYRDGIQIASKMMFINDSFTSTQKQIEIQYEEIKLILIYSLTMMQADGTLSAQANKMEDVSPVKNQKQQIDWYKLAFGQGKLDFRNGGFIMYNFGQRLDSVRWLYDQIISFLLWEDQKMTLIIAGIISLVIFNIRLAMFIGAVLFIIFRKQIINSLRQLKLNDCRKRYIVPEQNLVLLQDTMKKYNKLHDLIFDAITNEDRTVIVDTIDQLCVYAFILCGGLIILDFALLIVLGMWFILGLTSPYSTKIRYYLNPSMIFAREIFKITFQEITGSFRKKNVYEENQKIISFSLTKQLYIYEYERWFIATWSQPNKCKWSDQDWTAELTPKVEVPKGWKWLQNWKFVADSSTDENGFQYANDLDKNWEKDKSIKLLRRRKWRRRCILLRQQEKKPQSGRHLLGIDTTMETEKSMISTKRENQKMDKFND